MILERSRPERSTPERLAFERLAPTRIVFVRLCSERSTPERLVSERSRPERSTPANKEEAAKMIVNDIACVCEALCTLIHVAEQNDYVKKDELITESIKQLTKMLIEEPKKNTKED